MAANHRLETLSDILKHRGNLAVQCRCGHRSIVDGRKVSRIFYVRRWDTRRHMIGDHLRCSRCGGRPTRIDAAHGAVTGPVWCPKDEAGRKRLIARLRN